MLKKINSALISVYHKDNLDEIIQLLDENDVKIYSTGGTYDYIKNLGNDAISVESITNYPSILGGRVKTLHPKIFGGILGRRNNQEDKFHFQEYDIPEIDLVIVDLYPFEETVASGKNENEIIEKIDIGGISLIRAAAKNFNDVLVVPSSDYYEDLITLLKEKNGQTELSDRRTFAQYAFNVSSHYDTAIFNYFDKENTKVFKQSILSSNSLRYGENPHQEGLYYGELNKVFHQLHGKAISYNNLVDLDAAINLIKEFTEPTFAILKHTNACGIACRQNSFDAWKDALAGDPVSAFGGVLVTNSIVDENTALEINKLFFEIIISPDYEKNALNILKQKKNRIILQKKSYDFSGKQFKSLLNGVIEQQKDTEKETVENMNSVTETSPTENEKTI